MFETLIDAEVVVKQFAAAVDGLLAVDVSRWSRDELLAVVLGVRG